MGANCCRADQGELPPMKNGNGPKPNLTNQTNDTHNSMQTNDNSLHIDIQDKEAKAQMLSKANIDVVGNQTFVRKATQDESNKSPLARQETTGFTKMLSFKNFQGFKTIKNIKDHYEIEKELGKGAFGSVMLAKHIKAQTQVAVKIVKKSYLRQAQVYMDLMKNELEVLEKTTHPNIVRIFELAQDQKHYYIVMELMSGGNLLDRLMKLKRFTEIDVCNIVYQVLLALNYMHGKNITHRDLKPENLLCEEGSEHKIKLTDFGFACQFDPEKKLDLSLGSPLYMSPELVKEVQYDQRVDVWSIGVIAFILLSGNPPFVGFNKDETYKAITNDALAFDKQQWKNISNEAKDFIKLCLTKDYTKRAQVSELLEHTWIVKMAKTEQIDTQELLDITANLTAFKKASVFQTGIVSFLAGMTTNNQDLEELKKIFLKLDINKDGLLSHDELKQGMETIANAFGADVNNFEEILAHIDTDGDGMVDYQEFIAAAIDKSKMLNKKNLDLAFKVFDQDGDGQISKQELMKVFSPRAGMGRGFGSATEEDLWNLIMEDVDEDGDNQISYEEFANAMEKVVEHRATFIKKRQISGTLMDDINQQQEKAADE